MLVEARFVSFVLRLLEVSEISDLLRPDISFSPAATDFLVTVAKKMRTP